MDSAQAGKKPRHFISLNAQEALRAAIYVEARNARIYLQFAELFGGFGDADSRDIAGVFREMADEEANHEAELHERYVARYGDLGPGVTDEEVSDLVELPRIPGGEIFAIARAGVSSVPRLQGLDVALAAEEGALRFYRHLAEITDEPEFAALYAELAAFEGEHVATLRRQIEHARVMAAGDSA